MTLAEIREADAPPEVAAIYGHLRAGYGLPLVNLIWRHFATLPGILPWAWESVAPALPLLPAATKRLQTALEPLPSLPLSAEAAALARLYNRGNLSNLIVLTALLRGKQGQGSATSGALPTMLPAPAPLPRLDALSDKARREVLALAGLHGHADGVIPTLYLHLAQWPALLAPLYMSLSPLMATGRIARLREMAVAAANHEAEALRPYLAAVPAPPNRDMAEAALRPFVTRVIPEMVPIGLILGGQTP